MPDVRKSLHVLRSEWEGCVDCSLGNHRIINKGRMVFGEGVPRGILFVGEGPGKNEEADGRPFVGRSGEILRKLLDKWNIAHVSYITNLVLCRSCSPVLGEDGQQRVSKFRGQVRPLFKDEPPLPSQIEACRQRLLEEIYMIDPVVIVSLGGKAAEALMQKPVTITKQRGQEVHIEIPGASHVASLTEAKKQWIRKVGGQWVAPTEPNTVRYLLIPTLHPAYVMRKIRTLGEETPFKDLAGDIFKAVQVYEKYMEIVHGVVPEPQEDEDVTKELVSLTEEVEDDDDYYE